MIIGVIRLVAEKKTETNQSANWTAPWKNQGLAGRTLRNHSGPCKNQNTTVVAMLGVEGWVKKPLGPTPIKKRKSQWFSCSCLWCKNPSRIHHFGDPAGDSPKTMLLKGLPQEQWNIQSVSRLGADALMENMTSNQNTQNTDFVLFQVYDVKPLHVHHSGDSVTLGLGIPQKPPGKSNEVPAWTLERLMGS